MSDYAESFLEEQLRELRQKFKAPPVSIGDEILISDPGGRQFFGRIEKVEHDSLVACDVRTNLQQRAYHKEDPRFVYKKNWRNKFWRWEYSPAFKLQEKYRAVVRKLCEKVGIDFDSFFVEEVVTRLPEPEPVVVEKAVTTPMDTVFAEKFYEPFSDEALRDLLLAQFKEDEPIPPGIRSVKKREKVIGYLVERGTPAVQTANQAA